MSPKIQDISYDKIYQHSVFNPKNTNIFSPIEPTLNINDYLTKTEEVQIKQEIKGKKYDDGKPRYSLLPSLALEEIVKVLTFGSHKYEDFNWQKVQQPNDRFFSAAQRHLWAYQKGEKNDPESKYNHLACAVTNLMFMLDLELKSK